MGAFQVAHHTSNQRQRLIGVGFRRTSPIGTYMPDAPSPPCLSLTGMRTSMEPAIPLLLLLSSLPFASRAAHTMNLTQSIRDGDTLTSPNGQFALGFFSPGRSPRRYLGIWYTFSNQTVIWVANRGSPISDSSAVLRLSAEGNLTLFDGTNSTVWSSSTTSKIAGDPSVQMLDSGNLVVVDGSSATIWQSFDYPTDTTLAGMKIGEDFGTGHVWALTSWKSDDDPSTGGYFMGLDPDGVADLVMRESSGNILFRTTWNGMYFSGLPRMSGYSADSLFNFSMVSDSRKLYFVWQMLEPGLISRTVLTPLGSLKRYLWVEEERKWAVLSEGPKEDCDRYGKCGRNGVCSNEASEICGCLVGYDPVQRERLQLGGGCRRKESELCGVGEGFRLEQHCKLPDTRNVSLVRDIGLDKCEAMCLANCSCAAYAAADVRGVGRGCIMWSGDILDVRQFSDEGQDLYVRVSAAELAGAAEGSKGRKSIVVPIAVLLPLLVAAAALVTCYLFRKRRKNNASRKGKSTRTVLENNSAWEEEVRLFSLSEMVSITGNFWEGSKIGEGGFGFVYKGRMPDGQEVAVKRLSRVCSQGLDEFVNEVTLVAKLQHRNLVRLLGCCAEGHERILVYEYMQNKSLDAFLFGSDDLRRLLDWRKRVAIIDGIARGLVYLHQDSRLKIIHRDLKAGNILLDDAMMPKISDFGTARIFGGDQMEDNTRRVIGTYGYMSPEYATHGIISVKSDVFSFGVMMLEIVSGRKNRVLYEDDHHLNLLAQAWRVWRSGEALTLVDETLNSSVSAVQAVRRIQIGLLCVQDSAVDRPTMPQVVTMLSNETSELPPPGLPGFCERPRSFQGDSAQASNTSNEVTMTNIVGR